MEVDEVESEEASSRLTGVVSAMESMDLDVDVDVAPKSVRKGADVLCTRDHWSAIAGFCDLQFCFGTSTRLSKFHRCFLCGDSRNGGWLKNALWTELRRDVLLSPLNPLREESRLQLTELFDWLFKSLSARHFDTALKSAGLNISSIFRCFLRPESHKFVMSDLKQQCEIACDASKRAVIGADIKLLEKLEHLRMQIVKPMLDKVVSKRKELSVEREPPIAAVLAQTGVVPFLIELMSKPKPFFGFAHRSECQRPEIGCSELPDLIGGGISSGLERLCSIIQFEASWCVTNIASGSDQETGQLVEMGGLLGFRKLMGLTDDRDTADQTIWGIGNIAGSGAEVRDKVLETGIVKVILQLVDRMPLTMLRHAVWTFSNFTRGKPSPKWEYCTEIMPVLVRILNRSTDAEVTVDALWGLCFIADQLSEQREPSCRVQEVWECGAVRTVGGCLQKALAMMESAEGGTDPNQVIVPCVRFIGNLTTLDLKDSIMQQLLDAVDYYHAMARTLELSLSLPTSVIGEVLWGLSNAVAGSESQAAGFYRTPHLLQSVVAAGCSSRFKEAKEAGWCLANAMSTASFETADIIVNAGFFKAMANLLTFSNAKCVRVVAEAIESCFECSETPTLPRHWLQLCREAGVHTTLMESDSLPTMDLDFLSVVFFED